jgi:hypothetical protein
VFGLCPLSGVLNIREHNTSENGSDLIPVGGGGDTHSVGPPRKS